ITAPDGTLFVGNGDGAGYCGQDGTTPLDPTMMQAQDITSPRGKIFHINPNGSPAAGDIPGSFQNSVWAYGLRNPFRFDLVPGTSDQLWVGDVGWDTTEELDLVQAGDNMGWTAWRATPPRPLSLARRGGRPGAATAMAGHPIPSTRNPRYTPGSTWLASPA